MKTLTRKAKKVETWLPVFSGFYGTMWETDGAEDREIDFINELRKEKGLSPVKYDAIEWDHKTYQTGIVLGVTGYVGDALIKLGMLTTCKFQELRSPREYNFANDSVNVEITLSPANVANIGAYLKQHEDAFATYITETYTSCDGFMSSYSNYASEWLADLNATLGDAHQLGAVLQFVLRNEDGGTAYDLEYQAYEHVTGNGSTLHASNFDTLTMGK